jgi:hypothetical protein
MAKKSAKAKKPKVKVRDIKPKKDAKGGAISQLKIK